MASRDKIVQDIRGEVLRDPLRLITALGMRVDERNPQGNGQGDLSLYNGAERTASLVFHTQGARAGYWKAFNEQDAGGDCFSLVAHEGRAKTFPEQVEFLAGVYGLEGGEEPAAAGQKAPRRSEKKGVKTVYVVPAAEGRPEVQHVRVDFPDGDKWLWWAEAGTKKLKTVKVEELPLWRSWELEGLADDRLPIVPDGTTVVICEGEKDAEAVLAARVRAVGTYGSNVMATDDALRPLARFAVVLWADADTPGQQHMERMAKRLQALGCSLRQVKWEQAPVRGGAADALAAGGPDLVADLVAAALPLERLVVEGLEELPTIVVTGADLRTMTAQAMDALQAANHSPPVLFVRSGEMVRWRMDERSRSIIEAVSIPCLRGRMARCADWVKLTEKGGEYPTFPPEAVVKDALALPEWPWPPLAGVTEVAACRADGTIVNTPGYDPASRLIYAPAEGFVVPPVADVPGPGDVATALGTVEDVIAEFPFVGHADHANALALMLTPILRPAISGSTPLALLDAPQAGTGKSLLAEVVAVIATGRRAEMMSAVRDEDEWRKQITTVLLGGAPVVVIDNVDAPLGQPALSKAVTAGTWADRLLGRNAGVVLDVLCTWIATGNNLSVIGDFGRRCLWVRLDARQPRPWMRDGFAHGDLVGYVREQRAQIVWALLTMARAWFAQGCPSACCPLLGNMEEWCRVVGGVLACAGVEGFLLNLETLYEQVDQEGSAWEAFLSTWHDVLALVGPVTTAQLVHRAQDDERLRAAIPDRVIEPKGEINRRKLGWLLKRKLGLRVGEAALHLETMGLDSHTRKELWHVQLG
jgi:5S rRNA maturation endonuclease (ribonuclease M5)